MTRRGTALIAVASVAALLTVAACGGKASDAATATATGSTSLKGRTLNVVTWGGVWTDATKKYFLEPFAAETGVKVNYTISGTDPTSTVLLQEQQGSVQIDLTDSSSAGVLEEKGFMEHFPDELMQAIKQTSRPDAFGDYYLELGSTATLIVCNPELIKKCPSNAKEFWDVKGFPGDRAVATTYSSAMAFALMADGVPKDQLFPMDVERSIKKLKELKPHVKTWPSSGAQQQQVMIDKEVGMSFMWNGRAFVVKRDNMPNLILNWGDSTLTTGNGWAVPKGAPNKDVAFAAIKWVAEHPEAQAKWSEALTYPTPTKDLLTLVPKDIADALPGAHDPAVIPGLALAKQADEMRKAWQNFLTQ